MRHEVPQFIDIEDRIFGPLTFFQGIFLSGGFFGAFTVYHLIGIAFPDAPFFLKASLGIPLLALGIALAFIKVNKRPFIKYLGAWFYYTISPKKYIWHKKDIVEKSQTDLSDDDFILPGEQRDILYTIQNKDYVSKNNRSKLRALANSLDMETDF